MSKKVFLRDWTDDGQNAGFLNRTESFRWAGSDEILVDALRLDDSDEFLRFGDALMQYSPIDETVIAVVLDGEDDSNPYNLAEELEKLKRG